MDLMSSAPCSPTDDDPSNIKLESDFVIYVSEAIL